MSPIRHRAKRLESAIGICLLAILFFIAVGVLQKSFDTDIGRFGIGVGTTQLALQKSEISETVLSSFSPAGFKTLSKVEIYNPENLYEKIDGKAPLYIESGFEKLSTQRFASQEDENLWMELFVYDMGNIRNAFSVFSTQRRPNAETLSFVYPGFHYKTGNALYFVHGKFYVELIGSTQSYQLDRAMVKIAVNFGNQIAVDDTKIAELALFPEDNIVPDSIKLYLTNTFGFAGLTDTFTAQYKIDGETITAFLSKRTDASDAEKLADSYRNFLIENAATVKKTANEVLQGKILDFYGTTEIIFTVGPFVAGIHEAESQQAAEKSAAILIKKLSEQIKSNG